MGKKDRRINIRLDQHTYNLLGTQAARRGETISQIARRILRNNLQSDAVIDSQDVLIASLRKALREELRLTEKILFDMLSKAVFAAGSSENLLVYLLKEHHKDPLFMAVLDQCRTKAVALHSEPFPKIANKYKEI